MILLKSLRPSISTHSSLRVFSPRREDEHDAAVVIFEHLELQLIVKPIQLLLCTHLHLDEEGLDQLEEGHPISAEVLIIFRSSGEINHMCPLLNIGAAQAMKEAA